MGYLVLQRYEGEEIVLTVDPDVCDDELIRQLRGDGITLRVCKMQACRARGGLVWLGISAPQSVHILRSELVDACDR